MCRRRIAFSCPLQRAYGLKLDPCRAASKLRLFSSSTVALSEPLPRVREAVRDGCPKPGTRVSGFAHGGLPKLTSLGLVAAPVAAPAPAPTNAPTAIPGGPPSAPTPAPVAAPAAAPPLVRSGWLVPQPAKKAMVARKATLYQRPYPVTVIAAHLRWVREAIRSGICMSLFQASQQASTTAL
jgi:hypothetical protein